jgi:hypothetical protein
MKLVSLPASPGLQELAGKITPLLICHYEGLADSRTRKRARLLFYLGIPNGYGL